MPLCRCVGEAAIWASGAIFVCAAGLRADDRGAPPRLDQIQVIGTHNSYHLAPDPVAARLIRAVTPGEAAAIDFSHRPLTEQLDRLAVRQLELDLYLDPRGGLYARPMALAAAAREGRETPAHDPDHRLRAPGVKILHSPDFDFRTTVLTLQDALMEVRDWSDRNPRHAPVFVLLEPKAESYWPPTRPPAWNAEAMVVLEKEVLSVIPRARLLTPDDVRGDRPTLREAVEGRGWPALDAARGKFVLLLDDEGAVRDEYLATDPGPAGRLCFVSVPRDHPAAAWMKRNDPVSGFEEIRALVGAGFLVRTRADEGTRQGRTGDTTRRERAFASGAQIVSTDFPEADARWSDYAVRFPGGVAARPNPVTGTAFPQDVDLEAESTGGSGVEGN